MCWNLCMESPLHTVPNVPEDSIAVFTLVDNMTSVDIYSCASTCSCSFICMMIMIVIWFGTDAIPMHVRLNWRTLCAPISIHRTPCYFTKVPDDPRLLLLMTSGYKKKEARHTCLSEAKASHPQWVWVEVSLSAPHLLHSGLSDIPKIVCILRLFLFGKLKGSQISTNSSYRVRFPNYNFLTTSNSRFWKKDFTGMNFMSNSYIYIYIYLHSAVCLTTGPKPLPKPALHTVRPWASSFKWQYPLLSVTSSSSFLRLLTRLPLTCIASILSFVQYPVAEGSFYTKYGQSS